MQALDEGRLDTEAAHVGPHSPQLSPSARQESVLMVRTIPDEDMSFKEVPGRATSLIITEETPSPVKNTMHSENKV